MVRTPTLLQLLLLGVLSTTSHLEGQIIDCNDSKSSQQEKTKDDTTNAKDGDMKPKKKEKPPKIGNFSLPTSQQPAALFGFGGNIIDKGEVQIYLFEDDFVGKKKTTIDVIPSVLFGITDNWSVF